MARALICDNCSGAAEIGSNAPTSDARAVVPDGWITMSLSVNGAPLSHFDLCSYPCASEMAEQAGRVRGANGTQLA